jgi:hypothetical protein
LHRFFYDDDCIEWKSGNCFCHFPGEMTGKSENSFENRIECKFFLVFVVVGFRFVFFVGWTGVLRGRKTANNIDDSIYSPQVNYIGVFFKKYFRLVMHNNNVHFHNA